MRTSWKGSALVSLLLVGGFVGCGEDSEPTPPDGPTGSVRVTVTTDGQPLDAVTLRLFENGGATALATAATGANGQATFAELDDGDYEVEIAVPDGHQLAAGQTLRRDVTVADGGQATTTFALEATGGATTGQIRARVVRGATTVTGVSVGLYVSGGTSPLQTLTTGTGGQALFSAVVPGSYEVEIEVPAGHEIADGDTARKPVSVVAGALVDVQFAIESTATVVTIMASGTSFSPNDVTISPGTTVRWVKGTSTHTVTPTGHSQWTAVILDQPNEEFEHTFTTAGTFNYVCEPHQSLGMTGVVRVQN